MVLQLFLAFSGPKQWKQIKSERYLWYFFIYIWQHPLWNKKWRYILELQIIFCKNFCTTDSFVDNGFTNFFKKWNKHSFSVLLIKSAIFNIFQICQEILNVWANTLPTRYFNRKSNDFWANAALLRRGKKIFFCVNPFVQKIRNF